ncbi:MAG: hypothetical protein M3Q64_01365, partial [bacterium]|nr:hypothetical protein [bacterium]
TDTQHTTDFPVTVAKNITVANAITFTIDSTTFFLHLFGTFNVLNALLAIEFARQIGIPLDESAAALNSFNKVPGRMESIPNTKGFSVIVDYAPEPAAMKASLDAVNAMPHARVIHVFGSTGGHRDVSKRFEFGKISAERSDLIIITNDDVYDSDPEEIASNVAEGISQAPNKKASSVETVLDRKAAIHRAIAIAQPNDIVLITGKGSEQFLVLPKNERIAWDEREVVREILKQ